MDLQQALTIIAERRRRDTHDALLALDLAAATLSVIREDILANQILDIKKTLKTYLELPPPNPQSHDFLADINTTEPTK
jgi:hypothetical protein